jgi:predicted acylesterase/phospholipase RssA
LETIASTDRHHLFVLGRLFEGLDDDALTRILKAGEKYVIEPGEYLFRQNESGDSLYIVLSGRLRAVMQDNQGVNILGDIGEGEPTGEFALFSNEPRMASVLAIRKTIVLEIDKEEYLNLVSQKPAFASILTSFLIKRLRRNMLEQHRSSSPKNIALINLQADHDLSPWTTDIKKALEESSTPVQVFDHETSPGTEHTSLFQSLEGHQGLNILACSDAHPEWSRQCLLYADLIIVATRFSADPGLYPIEEKLDLYSQGILNKKIYLLLLHEHGAELPQHTSRWLHKRPVNLHLHIRKHHPRDVRRLCRIISGSAVGLVLGGGGARGYAHVGALRALFDAGVEIDFLGGTSAGALYGIGMSHCDFDFTKTDELCAIAANGKLTSNDYSWPLVSLMTGNKLGRFIKEMFGDSELEDIWVNSYCVSTNFSSSTTKVHDRGLARQMVQASMAIPGVFPPVVIDRQLHVDGCVVDNLPVEPMYRYPVRHIIAISLSSQTIRNVDYNETPSGRSLMWDRLTGKKQYRIPGIVSLIVNSLTLNSRQKQESTKAKVSLYFEMDLKDVGLLDDKKWQQTIQKGHDQTLKFLQDLPGHEKFWLK